MDLHYNADDDGVTGTEKKKSGGKRLPGRCRASYGRKRTPATGVGARTRSATALASKLLSTKDISPIVKRGIDHGEEQEKKGLFEEEAENGGLVRNEESAYGLDQDKEPIDGLSREEVKKSGLVEAVEPQHETNLKRMVLMWTKDNEIYPMKTRLPEEVLHFEEWLRKNSRKDRWTGLYYVCRAFHTITNIFTICLFFFPGGISLRR